MKSVCLSIVRNECDIIETFVRYNVQKFDHLFIEDHNSKDGTLEILNLLVKEGLPLTISQNQSPHHIQGVAMTNLLKEVQQIHKPSVLMVLDADEFVVGNIKEAAYEIPDATKCLGANWYNYVPTKHDKIYFKSCNILKQITYRNKFVNKNQHKVLIPGPLIGFKESFVIEGCHEVYVKHGHIEVMPSTKIHLGHFPIRSNEQFMKKSLVGWISKLANPQNDVRPDWSHWKKFFDRAKKNTLITRDELQCFASGYSFDQHQDVQALLKIHSSEEICPVVICDPMPSCEFDIKYHFDDYSALEALADAAEVLAECYARLQG